MDFSNNNIINMEFTLDKQLAILRLAKKQYVTIINNRKKLYKHNLSSFVEFVPLTGLCNCVQTSIYTNSNDYISFDLLDSYISVFNPIKVNELIKQYKRKYKQASIIDKYWYDTNNFQIRINVMNLLIQHLQLKIKENGKNLCNA